MKNVESCVYSTSGLTINDASEQAKTIFEDHKKGDATILKVGISDLQNKTEQELVKHYNTVKRTAPAARHEITAVPHRMDTGSTALNQKADYLSTKLRQKCDKILPCHTLMLTLHYQKRIITVILCILITTANLILPNIFVTISHIVQIFSSSMLY